MPQHSPPRPFWAALQIHHPPAHSLADSDLKLCLQRLSSPGSASFPVSQQTLIPRYLLPPIPPLPRAPGQPGLAWHPVPLQVPTKVMWAKSEPWDLTGPEPEVGLIPATLERTLTHKATWKPMSRTKGWDLEVTQFSSATPTECRHHLDPQRVYSMGNKRGNPDNSLPCTYFA